MSELENENVLKIIGLSYNTEFDLEIIMPLMDLGDLKSYLINDDNLISEREVVLYNFYIGG